MLAPPHANQPTLLQRGATTTRQILRSLAAIFGGLRDTAVPGRGTSIHHDATSHWPPHLASHSPVEAVQSGQP